MRFDLLSSKLSKHYKYCTDHEKIRLTLNILLTVRLLTGLH